MRQRVRRIYDDDAGVSLVELIIYALVASLVVGAASVILVNSWVTQSNVTSVTDATNRGQTISATIERAMRNALDFEVSLDGQTLRVRTSLDGDLRCQGFHISGGTARWVLVDQDLPVSTAAWTEWETGVRQNGTTPYFVPGSKDVTYTFDIATDSAPVRFEGKGAARSALSGESAPCWTT
jgi:Tfp pilus assembly protein PilW